MEEINWKCDKCNEKLDEYSHAMVISNVQVLEVNDEGRITASQSTNLQDEQLCYTCFTEKEEAAEQLKAALKHCLSKIAHTVELVEGDCIEGSSGALNELNELVVYIAGQLHPKKE